MDPAPPRHGPESTSLQMARPYLGHTVTVTIDRPYGSRHPVHRFVYQANYGHIPGTTAPDGEELDAYYLGPDHPLDTATGTCIAIIRRHGDDDDKLIVTPDGTTLTDHQIHNAVAFQERPGHYQIIRPEPRPQS